MLLAELTAYATVYSSEYSGICHLLDYDSYIYSTLYGTDNYVQEEEKTLEVPLLLGKKALHGIFI